MEVKKFEEPPAPALGLNESNPVKGFDDVVVVSVGFVSVEVELTGLFKNEKKFDAVVVVAVVVVEGVSFLSSFVILS